MRKQAAGLKVTAASTTRPQIERTGSRKRGKHFWFDGSLHYPAMDMDMDMERWWLLLAMGKLC
jgi:hypothetical protein